MLAYGGLVRNRAFVCAFIQRGSAAIAGAQPRRRTNRNTSRVSRLVATSLFSSSFFVALPAFAYERITLFDSNVHIQADGTLDVVETIHLVAEGIEIRHGIRRDFSIHYPGWLDRWITKDFRVIDVARDGSPEPYTLIDMHNGTQVQIGDPKTEITPGEHVYRIHYRTAYQPDFFSGSNELHWNVTGTGWTFPIDQAQARITLPQAVPFGKQLAYTGPQGVQGHDATVEDGPPGTIVFQTTEPLNAYEGLTIAVSWPKGVVAAPSLLARLVWILDDNGTLLLSLLGSAAILARCAWMLWRVRRYCVQRPVAPSSSPPASLSAAAIRYIRQMKFDNRTFTTAIVDAGVRGRLRIIGYADIGYDLEKTSAMTILPAAEEAMVERLFETDDWVALRPKNRAALNEAARKLNEKLMQTYGEGRTFTDRARRRFYGWSMTGGLFFLVALVQALDLGMFPLFVMPALAVTGIGGIFLSKLLWRRADAGDKQGRSFFLILVCAIYVIVFLVCWWWVERVSSPDYLSLIEASIILAGIILVISIGGGLRAFIGMASSVIAALACWWLMIAGFVGGNWLPMLVPVMTAPFSIWTYIRLRVPTAEGQALRDQIRSFYDYLSAGGKEPSSTFSRPAETAELFEQYLPYAMALDIENQWAARFTGVLSAAGTANKTPRRWYLDPRGLLNDPARLAGAVGAALTSALASAIVVPGSSSSSFSDSTGSGSFGDSSFGGGGGGGDGGGGDGGSGW